MIKVGQTMAERLHELEVQVLESRHKLRHASAYTTKLQRLVYNYERGKSWVATPPIDPVCSVCGMEQVELSMQPIDQTTSKQPSTITYFCGWGCVQLASNEVVGRIPRHALAGYKRT